MGSWRECEIGLPFAACIAVAWACYFELMLDLPRRRNDEAGCCGTCTLFSLLLASRCHALLMGLTASICVSFSDTFKKLEQTSGLPYEAYICDSILRHTSHFHSHELRAPLKFIILPWTLKYFDQSIRKQVCQDRMHAPFRSTLLRLHTTHNTQCQNNQDIIFLIYLVLTQTNLAQPPQHTLLQYDK